MAQLGCHHPRPQRLDVSTLLKRKSGRLSFQLSFLVIASVVVSLLLVLVVRRRFKAFEYRLPKLTQPEILVSVWATHSSAKVENSLIP